MMECGKKEKKDRTSERERERESRQESRQPMNIGRIRYKDTLSTRRNIHIYCLLSEQEIAQLVAYIITITIATESRHLAEEEQEACWMYD